MSMPANYEDVKKFFVNFMVEYRVNNYLEYAEKMTPIEGIVFLTLVELVGCFGSHNLSFLPQIKIGKYTVDFLLEYSPLDNDDIHKKIIIECDGHEYHERTKKQAEHDKTRDRYFTKLGYNVLRYTGSEIYKDRFKPYSDVEEMLIPKNQHYGFGYGPEYEKMLKEMSL